ncbi:hypothetical protein G9A89_013306 [Geosiphon pyriformis]|nr:hypothetical protein G9A89_013306 [Geosiphon pyriformis]
MATTLNKSLNNTISEQQSNVKPSSNGEHTARIIPQGSTALEGVGTNPTGERPVDKNVPIAHISKKGSTALEGVGTNPTGEKPLYEQQEHTNTTSDANSQGFEKLVKGDVKVDPGTPTLVEKASGAIDKAIGVVKESVGGLVGSNSMKVTGADQKAEGEARMEGQNYQRERQL